MQTTRATNVLTVTQKRALLFRSEKNCFHYLKKVEVADEINYVSTKVEYKTGRRGFEIVCLKADRFR